MVVTLNRQLLGLEDMAIGTGTVTQTRGGKEVEITEFNVSVLPFTDDLTLGDVIVEMNENLITTTEQAELSTSNANASSLSAEAANLSAIDSANSAQVAEDNKDESTLLLEQMEALYDTFDDRYLGAKATEPTVDNDGEPLKSGALYLNTTLGTMYVYEETQGWISLNFIPTDHNGLLNVGTLTHEQIEDAITNVVTQANVNSQAISNLATAQAELGNTNSLVLTTTEQVLSFTSTVPSTDTSVMVIDDTLNRILFNINANFNFRTDMNFYFGTSQERVITVRGRNVADDTLVYERSITIEENNGDYDTYSSNKLLTVGRNSIPESPLEMYFTIQCSGTGITLYEWSSELASGTNYDFTTISTFSELDDTPSGYAGKADKILVVNDTEDELEFSSVNLSDLTSILNVSSINIPSGTTLERPTLGSSDVALRYNEEEGNLEYWNGTEWGPLGSGGSTFNLKGTDTEANILAMTGMEELDLYVASDTLDGWVYSGTVWINIGPLQGPQGIQGPQGNSIESIVRTSGDGSEGTTDTYTITFTDTTTTTYDVRNGTAGTIKVIEKTLGDGSSGSTDTYTAYADIAKTQSLGTFDVYNGADGIGTTIVSLNDVEVSALEDGQVLSWDDASSKFVNKTIDTGMNPVVAAIIFG